MKVLITEGAGFVGRRFTKRLLEEGNRVAIIDSLVEGVLTQLSMYGFWEIHLNMKTLSGSMKIEGSFLRKTNRIEML